MLVYICDRCGDNVPENEIWHIGGCCYASMFEKDFEYEYCEVCFNKIKDILEDEIDS